MFGAIDEDQALGFPVAGKNAAANVRYDFKLIFQLKKKHFAIFLKGLCTLFALFSKAKTCLRIILMSKIMIQFCYLKTIFIH